MAQLAEMNEYTNARWNFREEVLQFLEDLKGALSPLSDNFEMITGDMCCGTCSAHELSQNMMKSNKDYGLYWHIQDETTLDEQGEGMWLGFVSKTDRGAERAAKAIVAELLLKNYKVAWDGSLEHRIYIKAPHLTPVASA
jgi:hypothetical protein